MAKYILGDKEVTEGEFNKQVFSKVEPFFLDEIVSVSFTPKSDAETEEIIKEIRKIAGKKDKTEEKLEDILKRNMNIGAPNYEIIVDKAYDFKLPYSGTVSHTGGTVFEKVQNTTTKPYTVEEQLKLVGELAEKIREKQNKTNNTVHNYLDSFKPTTITAYWQEKVKQQSELGKGVSTNPQIYNNPLKQIIPNQFGKKETNNKVNYEELDWDYIDGMSLRMSKNLDKYPPKNWQRKMDIKKLAEASIRHARKIIQEIENDEESLQDHAIALGCNGMMINFQLKNNAG